MNRSTYVIVPVYNEQSIVASVIKHLEKHFTNIICVNDGSTDNSSEEIAKTSATLLEHDKNKGQGAAIRTGLEHALKDPKARYFITFDADGQHDPEDALSLLKCLKKQGIDIALGSRFLGAAEHLGLIKKLVLKMAVAFTNRTTGVDLTDAHNGLRAFNRDFASKLHLRCNGMAHASEIIYRVAEGKFLYDEVPVTIHYTKYSKSKGQSVFNAFSILKEYYQYRRLQGDS